MGTGTTVRYLEKEYDIDNSNNIIDVSADLGQSMGKYATRYEFARLLKMCLVLTPSNEVGELIVVVRWNNEQYDSSLYDNDSAKRIPTHTVMYRNRTFIPPRIVGYNNDNSVKYSDYNSMSELLYVNKTVIPNTYTLNIPIRIYCKCTATNSVRIRIVLHFKFRSEKESIYITKYLTDPIISQRLKELEDLSKKQANWKVVKPISTGNDQSLAMNPRRNGEEVRTSNEGNGTGTNGPDNTGEDVKSDAQDNEESDGEEEFLKESD